MILLTETFYPSHYRRRYCG